MKKGTIIGLATAAAACAYIENFTIESENFDVYSNKIPADFEGYRVLQLSDFHSKDFGQGNRRLISAIDALHPDIILMTGDMVGRHDRSLAMFFRLCKSIGKRYPTYYTVGNHELDLADEVLQRMFAIIRSYGVHVLNNECLALTRETSTIELYGMWYGLRYYKNDNGNYRHPEQFNGAEMERLLGKKTSDTFAILMAHNPLDFPVYAAWGADLVFSGHIHGGVLRLPHFGGVFSPGRRLFPRYYAGVYRLEESELIVSRGLGGPRVFLNRPHLVLATLHSEN